MLLEIAIHFRFLQLYTHNAHNLAKGDTFFEDHEFLGELYAKYEDAYDATVERMIGLGEKVDLMMLQKNAADMVAKEAQPSINDGWFKQILTGEHVIVSLVEKCFEEDDEYTQGTLNLLAQFADDAEVRIYKLTRRLL